MSRFSSTANVFSKESLTQKTLEPTKERSPFQHNTLFDVGSSSNTVTLDTSYGISGCNSEINVFKHRDTKKVPIQPSSKSCETTSSAFAVTQIVYVSIIITYSSCLNTLPFFMILLWFNQINLIIEICSFMSFMMRLI